MARLLRRVLLGLLLLVFAILAFGPTEPVGVLPLSGVPEAATPEETVAPVIAAEALIPEIREGAAKEVIWAHEDRRRTPLSLVYVHDFAATKAEIRPVPDDLAEALGANLFYTRLAGHGRPASALADARATHWMLDMAEALDVGRAIGDRVLVLASSTGAALAYLAAAEPEGQRDVAGYVLLSPAFGLQLAGANLLDKPFARHYAPLLLGETQSGPQAPGHEGASQAPGLDGAWTSPYPTEALVPVAALANAASLTDARGATMPALFLFSEADQVIDPTLIREAAARWGGPTTIRTLTPGPGDDPQAHVLAGRLLGPGLTPTVTGLVLDWVQDAILAPEAEAPAPQPPAPQPPVQQAPAPQPPAPQQP